MAVSKEEIEGLYSRIPFLRPPKSIYQLRNSQVEADKLFDATHNLNRIARDVAGRWRIFGMTRLGGDSIFLAGNAPPSTVVHEGVHFNGVASEPLTYAISRALMARAQLNLGLRHRAVHYEQVPVSPAERDSYLRAMRLDLAPGESQHGELVHYVYRP